MSKDRVRQRIDAQQVLDEFEDWWLITNEGVAGV